MSQSSSIDNRPAWSEQLRGVRVSVFRNESASAPADGRSAVWHKVAVSRVYRDGETWKTTTSFGRDDIPVLRLLLDRAYAWVLQAEARSPARDEGPRSDGE